MDVKIEGAFLVIKIAIDPNRTPSASGKTLRVASTQGNVKTGVLIDGKPVIIGLNAYIGR